MKHPECSLDSFVLTGLVEQSALQYLGFKAVEATIDEKAEILFFGQLYDTYFLCLCAQDLSIPLMES
jgi:hypothetical protein